MRMHSGVTAVGLATLSGLVIAACGAPEWASTCPSISNAVDDTLKYAITVIDGAGKPVTGLAIYDTIPRTGVALQVPQPDTALEWVHFPAGRYLFLRFDDVMNLNHERDIVHVHGVGGGKQFSASYTIGESLPCKYGKIAGPDTVVVQ